MTDTPPPLSLVVALARLVGLPEGMPDDDAAHDLATEFALTLDSLGATADDVAPLALLWVDQLQALLDGTAEELALLAAHRAQQAAERRSQASQQAAATRKADGALRGLFDVAAVPHDWLGLDHDLPDDAPPDDAPPDGGDPWTP